MDLLELKDFETIVIADNSTVVFRSRKVLTSESLTRANELLQRWGRHNKVKVLVLTQDWDAFVLREKTDGA